jgi:hypothetical protein
MRPGRPHRSAQLGEQLELVGGRAQHAQRAGGVEGGISQRHRGSDRPHLGSRTGSGPRGSPRPLVRRAAASRPPPARPTRQIPRHRHRSRAAIPRPSDPARRSTSPKPSDCNRSATASRTRRTHRRACQDLCAKESQTHITALGDLPSAVIGEPVTSSVGHDVFSGIVGPLRLAFLLLEAGQFLYLIGLCALAGSVAAFCLSIV